MNVALINPCQDQIHDIDSRYPLLGLRVTGKPRIALGFLSLIANVRGHAISFIDNNVHKYSTDTLINMLSHMDVDVVAIGGTSTEWPQARDLSRRLMDSSVITIYGGPNATVNPRKHVRFFDYVVRGEGEESFQSLLDNLQNGWDTTGIPGISQRRNGDSIISDPAYNRSMETILPPDRHAINMDDYRRDFDPFPLPKPTDIVISTRGCPFNCRFCSSQYIWNRRYTTRPVQQVIAEIKDMIATMGTQSLHFREDHFTVDRQRTMEMCAALKTLAIPWVCQSRLDHIDEAILSIMKQSGCIGVTCGFESANDSTLNYIKKGITRENIEHAVLLFEKHGLYWSGGFMVGVLNEGEKEIIHTLDYVNRIRNLPYSLQPRGAMRFTGYPVSATYNEMKEKDLVEYDWHDGEILVAGTHLLKADEVDRIVQQHW